MYFAKVAWSGFNNKVENMTNILGGNVIVFLSIRLNYLVEKTGTFLKIGDFWY